MIFFFFFNNFILQRSIQLIKSDSKDFYIVRKDFYCKKIMLFQTFNSEQNLGFLFKKGILSSKTLFNILIWGIMWHRSLE